MKPFALILEEFYSGDLYFDMDADSSYYNTILRKPGYALWVKGELGKIKYMTPDEYFTSCGKMQHTTALEQESYVEKSRAEGYMQKMVDGEKFPIPIIDYSSKRQEGRHRSYAIKLIDPTIKMPVLLVYDVLNTKNDVIEAVVRNGFSYEDFVNLCKTYGIPHHEEIWYQKIKNKTL